MAIIMATVVAFPIYMLISRKCRVGLTTILPTGLIIGVIAFALLYPIFSEDVVPWAIVFAACGLVGGFIFWWMTERILGPKEKGQPVARPPLPSSSVDEKNDIFLGPGVRRGADPRISASRTGSYDGLSPYRISYVPQYGCRGSGSQQL